MLGYINENFSNNTLNGVKLEELNEREQLSYHQAARYGNVAVIQKYLQKYNGSKRKINKLDKQKLSALHYAVRYGHMEVIRLLLENNAKVEVVGQDGAQPIHYAAKYFKTDKHIDTSYPLGIQQVEPAEESEESQMMPPKILSRLNSDVSFRRNSTTLGDVISYLLENGADINAVDYYNQTPLNYAAVKGNIDAMTILLKTPLINLEETDTSGGTALHNACGNGHTTAAKLLLDHGAKLMVWDNEHMNPLHYAAMGEGMFVLQEIISDIQKKCGVEGSWTLSNIINDPDNEGQSLLHLAVDSGHYETCHLLIEKGANVNMCRNGFNTPLHLAAAIGNIKIVMLLVASGANVEAQNVTLDTPLHKAASFNRGDVAKFLLEKGCYVNSCNQDNKTPLMLASANGNKATIEVLLKKNADLHIVDSTEKSAIYWAAEENAFESLKLLLEHSLLQYDVHMVNLPDRFENTPLHVASSKGYKHVVNLLLENGADVDPCNDEDLTPLHLAAIYGNKKVVKALLMKKPSIINDEDESGNTALHLAALNGQPKVIELLIEYGASVDPRNTLLWTPLDCAAANGHVNAVVALLDQDSPIDPMDLASTTPLHLASHGGHCEVVQILLDRGADVTLLDHTGKNALDMAVEQSHREVALALLNHTDWLSLLKNRSEEGRTYTTPMRQLIKKLPDVAYTVLNKCMKLSSHLPPDSYDYKVIFYYDLLDDTYADWSNDNDDDDQKSVTTITSLTTTTPRNVNQLLPEVVKEMEKKENHPIAIMCKYKRGELLNHPLVLSLIYEKWQKYGRLVFYAKFLLYFLFLFFLTGYVLVSRPLLPFTKKVDANRTICAPRASSKDKDDLLVIVFVIVARYVVIMLGCIQLFLEIIQAIARGVRYFAEFTNMMEWSIYIFAIFFTWNDFDRFLSPDTSQCGTFHISIGSVCIFLAWINLLLFLQKFPTLGIYVVMFTDVLKTFMKFSITFLLFVVAFGLGFYTLLGEETPYMNIGRALLKTTVMMIGEFDFDSQFNSEKSPPEITWILFFIFVIVMTILLMNLMVGLAVDDIKGVLDQAVITRVAMQVHLVLDVEKLFPPKFRRRCIMKEKCIFPNRDFQWLQLRSHITTMEDIEEAINPVKSVSDIVQEHTTSIRESVDKLKTNFKLMSNQMKNVEEMLETLLKASNISNDTDD